MEYVACRRKLALHVQRLTSVLPYEAVSVAAPQYRTPDVGNAVMEQIRQAEINEQEPIGIIISRGSRAEEPPRFSAYVWGPFPGMESVPAEEKPVAA